MLYNKSPQMKWLKTRGMYFITVSWVRNLGIAYSFKAANKMLSRLCSHQNIWLGKNQLPNPFMFLAEFIFLRAVWLRFLLVAERDCSQLLGAALRSLSCVSFHIQFTTWLLASSKPGREFSLTSGGVKFLL